MTTIAIIYHSGTGTTEKLAKAIEEGAQSIKNIQVITHRILGEHIQGGRFVGQNILNSVSKADAVIFGSPTYMGTVSAQFKAFADATSEIWATGSWTDKVAAGFTVGSCYSGDQQSTVQYLQTLAAQHGMLWAGLDIKGIKEQGISNPLGAQSGLISQSADGKLTIDDLNIARYLGKRVGKLVSR